MKNLVEKYTVEAPEANDEGVVGIEYVVLAGLVAIGIGFAFAETGIFTNMLNALNKIVL